MGLNAAPDIALLTHQGDFFTVDRIAAALEAKGLSIHRIDTDLFPQDAAIEVRCGASPEVWWDDGSAAVPLHRVKAFWNRRLWPGTQLNQVESSWQTVAHRTAVTVLHDALSLLDTAYWMNPPESDRRAESKLYQLQTAQRLGFRTPETVVTNLSAVVQDFARDYSNGICTKLVEPLSQSMDGSTPFQYTTRVSPDDLGRMRSLRYLPQIFQPYLEKRHELRVAATRETVLAGAVDARGEVDWRQSKDSVWTRAELPPPLVERIHRLLVAMQLEFGALDFIVADDAEPIFLEINPCGEWGWLERDLDLPISQVIADRLARAL